MWAGGERLVRELMRILGNTVQEIVTMARLAFGAAGAAAGGTAGGAAGGAARAMVRAETAAAMGIFLP